MAACDEDVNMDQRFDVAVLGLGYVGLPAAVLLARSGLRVSGVDPSDFARERVENTQQSIPEPGLRIAINEVRDTGRLVVSAKPTAAAAYILAVPTPTNPDNTADISYVEQAAESICTVLDRGCLVVIESTVSPGTSERIAALIEARTGLCAGSDYALAHAPERVLPGNILYEIVNNDRIIGGITPTCAKRASELYARFVTGAIHTTDARTAEAVKLLENTYRDVNIALANEFALIASEIGVDAWEAIRLANFHPRVNVLRPGPGVGGHCLAVDPYFLSQCSSRSRLIPTARQVNDGMAAHVVELVSSLVGSLSGRRVALLGVSYKADVDDTRLSPSLSVARALVRAGACVRLTDPFAAEAEEFSESLQPLDEAVAGADCLVLLTPHSEYRSLVPEVIGATMERRCLVDAQGFLALGQWKRAGFTVRCLGVGSGVEESLPA